MQGRYCLVVPVSCTLRLPHVKCTQCSALRGVKSAEGSWAVEKAEGLVLSWGTEFAGKKTSWVVLVPSVFKKRMEKSIGLTSKDTIERDEVTWSLTHGAGDTGCSRGGRSRNQEREKTGEEGTFCQVKLPPVWGIFMPLILLHPHPPNQKEPQHQSTCSSSCTYQTHIGKLGGNLIFLKSAFS